jgi:apolipoprotein N-acyltransferase
MSQSRSMLKQIVAISRGILANREERRRFMGRFTLFLLGYFALGLWVLDGWLGQSLLRMLLYWFVCTLLALMLILFALYDVLRTVREERSHVDEE